MDEAGTPLCLVPLWQKLASLLVGTAEKGMSRGILDPTLLSEKYTHEAVLLEAEAEYKKLVSEAWCTLSSFALSKAK